MSECDVFRWVGQSFRSCDDCGKPFWEHHFRHRYGPELQGGPFGPEGEPVALAAEERLACLCRHGTQAELGAVVKLP